MKHSHLILVGLISLTSTSFAKTDLECFRAKHVALIDVLGDVQYSFGVLDEKFVNNSTLDNAIITIQLMEKTIAEAAASTKDKKTLRQLKRIDSDIFGNDDDRLEVQDLDKLKGSNDEQKLVKLKNFIKHANSLVIDSRDLEVNYHDAAAQDEYAQTFSGPRRLKQNFVTSMREIVAFPSGAFSLAPLLHSQGQLRTLRANINNEINK